MKESTGFNSWKQSKYTNYEMILESQFASAGAHQARLLEKCEKSNKYVKRQSSALKIASGFVMMLMPLLSIIMYFEIIGTFSPSYPLEGKIFIYSFFLWINLIITILYVFLFGLFTTSSLMSGTAFKWLQTMPVSRNDLKRLGFMTLFRSLSVPLIIMMFSFPIVLFIITLNFYTFLTSLVSTFLITILSISLLIIVGDRFSRVFAESNRKSGKANILRMVTLIGFFFIAFGSSLIMNFGMNAIADLIVNFGTNPPSQLLNMILSFFPLPFAPGYLIGLTMISDPIPVSLLYSSLIGMGILAVITYLIYRVAIRSLSSVTTFEIDLSETEKETKRKKKKKLKQDLIEVKTTSPVRSYIRKDLIASTRDYQSLIFVLMPLVFPIIMILSMQTPIIEEVSSSFSIMILWMIILIAIQFIPFMLVGGLLNLEESGSSTLASLPVVPRDQAKGKLILMLTIQGISLSLMAIILTVISRNFYVLILILSTLPIAWAQLLFIFQMKVRLFGTMKYKYVLEEVNARNKLLKWISIIAADLGVCTFIAILGFTFFLILGFIPATLTLFFLGLIGLSVVVYTFTKMFPVVEKLPQFETRGLFRNKPVLGAITILLLFNLFLTVASFVEFPFLGLLSSLGYTGFYFVDFLITECLIILLFLIIIPIGMKLPRKYKTILEYTKAIGLTRAKPLARNLLVGFGSFAILCCVLFIGGILLGDIKYTLEFLVRIPGPTLGWFVWIFMIRPGLWEEVAYRGVVIPLLSRKYKKLLTILISGVIFGLAHAFNIIPVLFSGGVYIGTLYQFIYTTLLGFSMGYMYIKSKSLLPSIIYHYLFDTVGLVFTLVYIETIFLQGVFTIVFIGIIPSILSIGLTKLVFWKDYNKDVIINKR